MSEQEFAVAFSKAFATIAPNCRDAIDFGLYLRGHPAIGEARAHIHRQMAAQRLKTRMQLRTHRAGNCAGVVIPWPQVECGKGLGEIFTDGQTLPNHELSVSQR